MVMEWAVVLGETFHASVWTHRLGFGVVACT